MLRLGWATGSCRGLDGLGETSAADQTDFGKLSLEKAFGKVQGYPQRMRTSLVRFLAFCFYGKIGLFLLINR